MVARQRTGSRRRGSIPTLRRLGSFGMCHEMERRGYISMACSAQSIKILRHLRENWLNVDVKYTQWNMQLETMCKKQRKILSYYINDQTYMQHYNNDSSRIRQPGPISRTNGTTNGPRLTNSARYRSSWFRQLINKAVLYIDTDTLHQPRFCGKPSYDETFNNNNMQIIEFCCEQFNFILPSRQIAKRRDKNIKSDSQRTNSLTFINM